MHDREICEVLRDLGVPAHLKGFAGARVCINIVLEHPDYMDSLVKKVYATAAAELGSSTSRIERAIRHAISYIFEHTDMSVLECYFGRTIGVKTGKVTNKCFIATIADYIKMEVE